MPYKLRPAGEDLVTFMRREYRDKGLIPHTTYSGLLKTDDTLARAYQRQLDADAIPDELRLPKERSQSNRHERARGVAPKRTPLSELK
jgi:hypothetical protein